jgi:hypothetical protein
VSSKEKAITVNTFSLISVVSFSRPNVKIYTSAAVVTALVLSILC